MPRPVDTVGALAEAIRRLAAIEGDKALIGGVALSVYGIVRYTKDVDLAVSVAQSSAAEALFADADPQPLRIGGVSILTSSGVRVDLIDRRDRYGALYAEAIEAAHREGKRARAEDVEIPVVPLPYLVAIKMAADRPKDEADLDSMLRLPELDLARTRQIVEKHLGPFAAGRLDRLARAVGRSDAPKDYENGGSHPS